ncbi:12323_t:CDS:2, partial [Racocetra fulgida]
KIADEIESKDETADEIESKDETADEIESNNETAILKKCQWRVIEINDEHNHSMAEDKRVFHEHCQLTREARCTVVRMLKAGPKPSMIYEAVRDKTGTLTVTRKDISNIGLQINSLEETTSMEALIVEMEERGNLGVNKLQTFGIAGAWISDESEKSYIWVIEQLASLIFLDISPFVFITDNDAALIGALRRIFPKVEHILCSWHVLNNFKKNLKKYFVDDSFYEIINIMEGFINLRDYKELNFAISDYRKLATSSLNTEKKESIGIDPLLMQDNKDHLRPLLGRVSQFALNKIKCELFNATTYEACLCELCVNYNLPCRHLLPIKGPILLSIIPKRWLLFPEQGQLDSNNIIQNELLDNSDNEQQKSSLLEKLDDILAIPEVKLSDIKVPERIIGKGRPSRTKRLPTALECMEQEEKKKKRLIMGQTKLKTQVLIKKK